MLASGFVGMRIFSDFSVFERPPKLGVAWFRWLAWQWLLLGLLFTVFVAFFFGMHYLGGEPIYFTNEDRYLSEKEVRSLLVLFLSGGDLFLFLGLAGVFFLPRN